ncbi:MULTISPECIES: hypothetical protein [Pseudomonas]|uniref:hypothetical protein n=1 Tax=Pseudomonas TaxID=286 RepID=UPI001AE607A9|nr:MULTISPECIES: hypothetical protein [unclassified Pseudomonas]MBP1125235.1 hypothetical protein [Pseudomonas sp. PvP025]MDQ0399095.1 hypothetical protein [Pseudomonas sp. PvP006]
MCTSDAKIADALELMMINQNALGAAVEELSRWILQRGSEMTHTNALGALETLDQNAESLSSLIRALRQEPN